MLWADEVLATAARNSTRGACVVGPNDPPNDPVPHVVKVFIIAIAVSPPIDRPVEARHILHECVETRPARLGAQRIAGERHGHSLARA